MKYGSLNLGQIEATVNKLGGMEGMQDFLAGKSKFIIADPIIDCDADPFVNVHPIPKYTWRVVSHRKHGYLKWDPAHVELWYPENRNDWKLGPYREVIKRMPALNANVLDFLLKNPHLIPDSWQTEGNGGNIVFWGTVYLDYMDRKFVRCLSYVVNKWIGGEYILPPADDHPEMYRADYASAIQIQ